MRDGQSVGWRLGQPYVSGDFGFEYPLPSLEVVGYFGLDFAGEIGAVVVHGEEDAFDVEVGVKVGAYEVICLQELA